MASRNASWIDMELREQNSTEFVLALRENSSLEAAIDPSVLEYLKRLMEERSAAGHHIARLEQIFAVILVCLGVVAVLLNLLILAILARHHRHVAKHAFYMLISNFAFIDSLKGFCLILWATKTLVPTSIGAILIFKVEQVILFILRFSNLGTILNLLMITLNEFLFIKFPLMYHIWVTKRRVCCLITLSWILSAAFTLLSTLARMNVEAIRIVPCPDLNATAAANESGQPIPMSNPDIMRFGEDKCILKPDNDKDTMPMHNVFTFTIIGFCAVCLVVVVTCYAVFFRIIHRIRKQDAQIAAEMLASAQSHQRRTSSQASCYVSDHVNSEERRIKKQLLRRSKYVLVIGSVIFIYILYLISYSTIQILQYLQVRVRDQERGMSAFSKDQTSLIIRWSFQTLVGLHSIFQPLCYFRMREFRDFVNKALGYPCRKRRGSASGSEWVSTSHMENEHLLAGRNSFRSSSHPRVALSENSEGISLMQIQNKENGFIQRRENGRLSKGSSTVNPTLTSSFGENGDEDASYCSTSKKQSVQFSSKITIDEESEPLSFEI